MKKLPMLTKSFLGISAFLAIPLIIAGFIFYYNLIRYSENEISKSSITNLQNVKKLNDQLVESITKQTIRLSLDISMQEILNEKHYSYIINNPERMVKFMQVTQILSETVNMNYRIKSIYVYLDDSDYIISSNQGVMPKAQFSDMAWIDGYMQRKNNVGAMWFNSRLSGNSSPGDNSYVITCLLPLKMMVNYDGAIVVNISEPELNSYMNDSNSDPEGYVFIINDDGTVVSHYDKSLITKNLAEKTSIKQILQSPDMTGYFISDDGTGRKLFTYYKSEFNHWIYINVLPMDSMLGKVNSLAGRILLFLFALMLIGVLTSYIFSRSMYNPVKKLMIDIQKRKGVDFREAGNEMAIISRAFDALARQEDALSNELEKNKRQLQNKYIMDLLEGNNEKSSNRDDAENTGISFRYPYFISAIMAIDKYDAFAEKHQPEQQYYLKMMVLKACEEIAGQYFTVYGILYEKNKLALVMNSASYHPEGIREQLRSCFLALQKEVGKVMSNTITISIGNCYDNISKISISFNEAKEALTYRIVAGSGSIIFCDDFSENENKYYYPYQTETHILNYLKLGSKEELLNAVDDLILELKTRKGLSADNIIQIFIQLIGNTVKFLVELNVNVANIFGGDYNIYHKLSAKETLDDIRTWLIGFYSGILKYMSDSPDMSKSTAADRVMDYLHKNYRSNIDTTAIATNTGLGYSSIGRIVKSKTGKNVLEYINGLRIEEAKRLLRQTNMTVVDIALSVGYNNDQSFSRFFKKFEGVTPGEFRNLQNIKQ